MKRVTSCWSKNQLLRTARISLATLGVIGSGEALSAEALPEPLSLAQALSLAEHHPRLSIPREEQLRLERAQPVLLGCRELALSVAESADPTAQRIDERWISPLAAQRLEILGRYFDVLLADLSYALFNESMAVAYIQFDRARVRSELGETSELRVLELEAAYQDILRRRVASQSAQRLTRAMLADAMGRPGELPRDLFGVETAAPRKPIEIADLIAQTSANTYLNELKQGKSTAHKALIDMAVRARLLRLLLRLESLAGAQRWAQTEADFRDLKLEQSRTLYELEVTADLGFSMSQQTRTQLLSERIRYCTVLTQAEIDALTGHPLWPATTPENQSP